MFAPQSEYSFASVDDDRDKFNRPNDAANNNFLLSLSKLIERFH